MLRFRIVMGALRGLSLVALGVVAAVAAANAAGSKEKSADTTKSGTPDPAVTPNKTTDKKPETTDDSDDEPKKVVKTEAEWKKILTREQFHVTRKKGTERAFGPGYLKSKKDGDGTYHCVCCGQRLFDSRTKFESGTGWPSFYQPLNEKMVKRLEDTSAGDVRVEIECSRCDAHLGHVFSDGPRPTGERFCMNAAALKFASRAGANHGAKAKEPKSRSPKTKAPD